MDISCTEMLNSSVQAFKIADSFTTVSLTGYHKVVYLTEIDYWCTVGIIQVRNFVERGQIFFDITSKGGCNH